MSEIIIIAAVAKNNVIGKDGQIPWHLKEDFQHFKKLTMGFPVIMGKKTYESLPVKPLPGRVNVVVTHDHNLTIAGVVVKNSLDTAIEHCKKHEKIFIIGGQSIYEQAMKLADRLELTLLDKEYEGNVFFPNVDLDEWSLENKDERDGYSFVSFLRKRSGSLPAQG